MNSVQAPRLHMHVCFSESSVAHYASAGRSCSPPRSGMPILVSQMDLQGLTSKLKSGARIHACGCIVPGGTEGG